MSATAHPTAPAVSASGAPPLLKCVDVSKSFGPSRALAGASLEVRSGEIHAILGENGSGKSTLVKILSGVQREDSGTIRLRPRGVSSSVVHQPVATVFQEVLVVNDRSILENVWLGTNGLFRARVPKLKARRLADELLTRLLGRRVDLDDPVSTLSLSDQQTCCIARALVPEPDLLILDEATSALDLKTRDRVFELLREQRAAGMGVIFISHRMDELLDIADRTTVMRSGRTVAVIERADTTVDGLVASMTGRERAEAETVGWERAGVHGPVALRAEGLVLAEGAAPIDLEVRAGEIIGLAGLDGHGQEALLLALWGQYPSDGASGRVVRFIPTAAGKQRDVVIRSARQAARNQVAYVPRDRRKASIFASQSILDNFAITTLGADTILGLTRQRARRERFSRYRETLAIRLGRPDDAITTLSGGNQQKVILARWLATEPRVLLLNDPTRGIDLGAKADIYALLGRLAAEGAAIVMLSSELGEHLNLMDRVIVMREHSVFATVERDRISRETLVSAFFGVEEDAS